jgi:predicted component of type VI protein secretion system
MINFEKPIPEKLFFDKFFIDDQVLNMKAWKSFKNQSFNLLQESICKNIEVILNTKNALKIEDYLEKKLTFLDFGVPDFLTLHSTNNISFGLIEKCIERAIHAFEPRLFELEVELKTNGTNNVIFIKGKTSNRKDSFFEIMYHKIN